MKKWTAFVLLLAVALSLFSACGIEPDDYYNYEGPNFEPNLPATTDAYVEPETTAPVATEAFDGTISGDISYVLIYNPNIYDEEDITTNGRLSTGSFGSQINVDMFRADGLEEEESTYERVSQNNLKVEIPEEKLNLEGGRADPILTPYKEGDTKDFFRFNKTMTSREKATFVCRYAGEYCNIWTCDNSLSDKMVSHYGAEFDNNIFRQTVDTYGTGRFTENGGKVNLMFYPMRDGVCGVFYGGDLFSSMEVPQQVAEYYGLNTDHAMVHVNSTLAAYEQIADVMAATAAHEFQHLICQTDAFYTIQNVTFRTWLNEAMSGYIEEQLYPGSKALSGDYKALALSAGIRHGQSMYNFENNADDIGVYGSVYMFSEYLADLAGENVFYDLHNYWRTSYSLTLSDAEALVNAVPDAVYKQIDSTITYPGSIYFAKEEEEWMSKLVLDFYLSMLSYDAGDPEAFQNVYPEYMIYDEINPASIEGGGRVIVAVNDGRFEIPTDADGGLVYVGLDQNFQVTTPFYIQ